MPDEPTAQHDWRSTDEKLRELSDSTDDPKLKQLIEIVLDIYLDLPDDTADELQQIRSEVSTLGDRLDNADSDISRLEDRLDVLED